MGSVASGTIDRCRHCDKRIVHINGHRGEDDKWVSPAWWHTDEQGKPSNRECPKGDRAYATHATPKNLCVVYTENSGICYRRVTNEKWGMCGIHARFKQDEEDRREEWEQAYAKADYFRREVEKSITRLKELGVEAEYAYGLSNKDGAVLVDPSALIDLLEELRAASSG